MTIYSVALAEYLSERGSPTLKTSFILPFLFFCFVNEGEYTWKTCFCVNSMFLFVILICWQPPEAMSLHFKLFSSNMDIYFSLQSQILTHKSGVAIVERQSQGQIFQALDLI